MPHAQLQVEVAERIDWIGNGGGVGDLESFFGCVGSVRRPLAAAPHLAWESLGGMGCGVVAKGNERNSQLQLTESESVRQSISRTRRPSRSRK